MSVTKEALERLREPFPSASINWRVGQLSADKTTGQALPYLDGRAVQNRLDEALGPENWQVEYKSSPLSNGLICRLGIRVDGQWVFKEDGAQLDAVRSGGRDDTAGSRNSREMAVKGAYTDAFKRVAVMWGIGRYLYSYAAPWVAVEPGSHGYVLSKIPELPAQMRPAGEPSAVPTENAQPAQAPTPAPAKAAPSSQARSEQAAERPNSVQTRPTQAAPAQAGGEPQSRASGATPARAAHTAGPTNATRAAQPAQATQPPARAAQPASNAGAPARSAGGKALPEGLGEEERAIVTGLLEKIARPAIPMTMLENYIAGPRVAAKLSAPAKAFLEEQLAERRKRESAAA